MVILDTSIIYKWVTEEDSQVDNIALNLLQQFLNGKEEVFVPDIMLYELANALSTKTTLTLKESEKAWSIFEGFHLKIIYPTFKLIKESLKFSKQHKVSVYDASYAILAEEKKCNFYTADSTFVKRVNLSYIKHLSAYSSL